MTPSDTTDTIDTANTIRHNRRYLQPFTLPAVNPSTKKR